MIDPREYTFDEVGRFLKLSKSAHGVDAPYTLVWHIHSDWADILDKTGATVGQVSGLEWLQHGPCRGP